MKASLIGYGRLRTKKKKKTSISCKTSFFRILLLGQAFHPLTEEILAERPLDGQLIARYDVTSARTLFILICITVIVGVGWEKEREDFKFQPHGPTPHTLKMFRKGSLSNPLAPRSLLDRCIEKGDSSGLCEQQ